MKIVQIVLSLAWGDAVGNDVIALHEILKGLCADTRVYVKWADGKINKNIYNYIHELPKLGEDDILLYHMAIGSAELCELVKGLKCRKYIIYHNITPPRFFQGYNEASVLATKQGLRDMEDLRGYISGCLADSEFNKQELLAMGYEVPMAVMPIIVPFSDYDASPSDEVLSRYAGDGYINLLFVGRKAPNKKQEDIIRSFAYYQKYVNSQSRLFLVGNEKGNEAYCDRLRRYVKLLGVNNVLFLGHVSFKEILAYYRLADLFLCMSEHEGFCVPLLESMYFDVPVLAYNSTAVPYTMENAGVIFSDKDPAKVAYLIEQVTGNQLLKKNIMAGQRERLRYFSYENVSNVARSLLADIMGKRSFASGKNTAQTLALYQKELLQKADRVESKEEIPCFDVIPMARQSIVNKCFFATYNLVHYLAPVTVEKIKFKMKNYYSK